MSDFDYATQRVWELPKDASAQDKLHLYKQATVGDCNIDKPRGIDKKGQLKWDAWNSVRGMSQDEAKERYVAKAKALFAEQGATY